MQAPKAQTTKKTKQIHVFGYMLKLKIAHFKHEIKVEAVYGISCLRFVFSEYTEHLKTNHGYMHESVREYFVPQNIRGEHVQSEWLDWCQCNLFRRVVSANVKPANTDTIWYWTIIVQIVLIVCDFPPFKFHLCATWFLFQMQALCSPSWTRFSLTLRAYAAVWNHYRINVMAFSTSQLQKLAREKNYVHDSERYGFLCTILLAHPVHSVLF